MAQASALGVVTTCINITQRLPVSLGSHTCSVVVPTMLEHFASHALHHQSQQLACVYECGTGMQALLDADAYGGSQLLLAMQQELLGKQMQSLELQRARLQDLMCASVLMACHVASILARF
jgi:hypothetical protein